MATLPTTGSAIPPPPGVTPHPGIYSAGERTAWKAATIVMLVVPTIFVALRFFVKKLDPRTWTAADYICIIAWALNLAMVVLAFELMNYGLGYHGWNISPRELSQFARIIHIQRLIYQLAIFFTKSAIFVQLYQIFCVGTQRSRRWILTGALMINIVFFTTIFFVTAFNCTPQTKIWDPTIPGSCLNTQYVFIAVVIINLSDYLLVLIMPVSWVWKLNMARNRKLAISATFAAIVFSCICSIVRLAECIIDAKNQDKSYVLIPVSLWGLAEVASGVVVCCLPLALIFIRMNFRALKGNPEVLQISKDVPKTARGLRGKLISDESLLLNTHTQVETSIRSTHNDEESRAITENGQAGSNLMSVPESAILRRVEIEMTARHV